MPKNDELPVEVLCKLCNKITETGEWPTDWRRSVFITIKKIGGTTDDAEDHNITLISYTSKIFLRVLKRTQIAEKLFTEEQMGSWRVLWKIVVGSMWMNNLRFADDIVLISTSPAGL